MPDTPLCVIRIESPCTLAGRMLVAGDAIVVDLAAGDPDLSVVWDAAPDYDALWALVECGHGVIRVPDASETSLFRAAMMRRRQLASASPCLRLVPREEAS